MSLPAGTPFVVFGDDWGAHVSSMQHLFRHIVTAHQVIWINGIGHRVPTLSRRDLARAVGKARAIFSGRRGGGTGVDSGPRPSVVLDPFVFPWHHWPGFGAYNRAALLRAIRRALRDAGITSPPVLVTGSPPSAGVVGELGELASVYFCMDDFLHLPGTSPEMLAVCERRLLERVDAVVATAASLTRSKRPASGRAFHLPQGVNYDHFADPQPVPPDLAALPRPLIGFAGALHTPCDLELMAALARAHPQGSLVVVGPIRVDPGPLTGANVHLLGPRPYRDLPAYVQHFDVGIIPYRLNDHTVAVDPLKTLEYLAAGIPVVSTALPEMAKYAEVVAVADDAHGFLAAVATAVTPGDDHRTADRRDRGRRVAESLRWERRSEEFLSIVSRVIAERTAAGRSDAA